MTKTDRLAPEGRQSRLRDAAQQYARGQLSPDQFKAIQRRFGPDYRAGAAAIAWRSLNPLRAVRRLVRRAGLA